MYEGQTFEVIMQRMLGRISDTVDKREGSVIYDAIAPAAWELFLMYQELESGYNLAFADTATGEYLAKRTAEFGVNRTPATAAIRRGEFYDANNNNINVPIGSRYAIGDHAYIVIAAISTGVFELRCETLGAVGNQQYGSLLPLDYVTGLARAELANVLVPGEDEESDESLRNRYYEAINEPAFGGNIADYKQTINAIVGVGATKIFPIWNGGGTVKATIIASDWGVPSSTLVNEVQELVDPTVNSGQGVGTAPIGHVVTVTGVVGVDINVVTTVSLAVGVTPGQVKGDIEAAISAYLLELRRDWANQSQLVVRVAQIDARILTVPNVEDVIGTTLNGGSTNVTLGSEQIPILGTVTVNG